MHSTVARFVLAETVVQKVIFPPADTTLWPLSPSVSSLERSAVVQHFYLCFLFACQLIRHLVACRSCLECLGGCCSSCCSSPYSCWYVTPPHPAEPLVAYFIYLSLPTAFWCESCCYLCMVGWFFFFPSYIYLLSLWKRTQTIWREQGWRSYLKLCCVHAVFLYRTSFFKHNPRQRWFLVPVQWVALLRCL